MAAERIDDPMQFFARFSLHDVRIDRIEFDPDREALTLWLNDLNANLTETPDYQGCRPCALSFDGVAQALVDVDTQEGIRISQASVLQQGSLLRLELDLNLGGGDLTRGRRSVAITFELLHLKDLTTQS